MNHIEKEKLIKADIASIENRVRHAFNQGYDLGYKEGKANCSEIPTGSTTKNDLGVDCISRAEVLRLMKDNWHTHNGDWAMQESMDDIRALPSVTSQAPCDECEIGNPCLYCKHEFEAKTGHWYRQTNDYVDYYECSECGMAMGLYDVKNYCPNCGSRNEVEE